MTIRSTRSKKAVPSSDKQRQPLGTIEASKNKQETKKKETTRTKIDRRKSRQIGDDVVIFIQERNSKSGKRHRAKIDPITGGITFTPGNRKTPIAYDRNRHTLIETTPEGDQVEVQLQCDNGKENTDGAIGAKRKTKDRGIQKTDDESAINNEKSGTIRRRGNLQVTRSYADSTDPESSSSDGSSEGESDFEVEPTNKGRTVSAKRKNEAVESITKPVNRSGKRNPRPAKVAFNKATQKKSVRTSRASCSKTKRTDDDSDEGAYEPAPSERSPIKFSSPVVKAEWDDRPDWRCAGAIDY